MPYGYLGQNTPNQLVRNAGVLSIDDVYDLEKKGHLGGSVTLLNEITCDSTGVANIDWTNIDEDKYDVHLIVSTVSEPINTRSSDSVQLYENGVLESASVYERTLFQVYDTSGTFETRSTAQSTIGILSETTTTGKGGSGFMYLFNAGNSSVFTTCYFINLAEINNGQLRSYVGGGTLPQASLVDGIRITSSNNISNATFKMFGIKDIN